MSSRDVAHDLLLSAVLDIRALSEPGADAESVQRINLLARPIHNWVDVLRDATDEASFDAALSTMWAERDRRSDPWLAERMAFFGVDHRSLE